MEVHEKIRKLRKQLSLNQQQFAEKLGISRSNLCNLELGRVAVTDRIKKQICSEFNVNPHWLSEEGSDEEMFTKNLDAVDQLVHDFHLTEKDRALLLMYTSMTDSERKALYTVAKHFGSAEKK